MATFRPDEELPMRAHHLFAAAVLALATAAAPVPAPESAYDFTMTAIDGTPMPLSQWKGRVLLVVNTASFCGFTPQYEALEKLSETYKDKGLIVLGVPSGDFAGQEYDDNGKIKKFCESKFGIKFPLAEKASVIGPNATPFYKWASAAMGDAAVPKWNFHKILIGRDGRPIAAFPSKVTPDSPLLAAAVVKALATN